MKLFKIIILTWNHGLRPRFFRKIAAFIRHKLCIISILVTSKNQNNAIGLLFL